eukprot:jgi/Chlat1/4380/Chrsp29S04525
MIGGLKKKLSIGGRKAGKSDTVDGPTASTRNVTATAPPQTNSSAAATNTTHPLRQPTGRPTTASTTAAPASRSIVRGAVPAPQGSIAQAFAEPLPSFRDVPASERQALFVKKLHLCSYVFDFTDATNHVKEKEIKRQTLLELVDYVNTGSGKFTEAVFQDITYMLSCNLFRTLPPSSHDNANSENYDPEEEEPTLEPAWPHLQIVYEFLLRYVISNETDAKVARKYIDTNFVLRLLDLFDSEDPRERDYLKTILHRIYGKFMVHRPFIRKAVNNIFYRFIFETERHNGVAELLEILGSIINGFALPLKDEHKVFLMKALIPLHKPKCVSMYHQQLSYCITQFVEKDLKLAEPVVRGLLKYWPVTNSQKEVLFLGELEEVLELTQTAEFQKCMVPVAKQIAKCLNSSHFQARSCYPQICCESLQVAERALFLWNNDYIVSLLAQNRHVILPIIFPALERNARSHWNAAVHGLTLNVRKMFQEVDSQLFEECVQQFKEDELRQKAQTASREEKWLRLEKQAEQKRKVAELVAARSNGSVD